MQESWKKSTWILSLLEERITVKVKTTINYDDLKKRAIEKYSHHDQSFGGLEEYVLLYLDGKEALFLPGITTTRFQLVSY